jgi:probable rRNA maturation factor
MQKGMELQTIRRTRKALTAIAARYARPQFRAFNSGRAMHVLLHLPIQMHATLGKSVRARGFTSAAGAGTANANTPIVPSAAESSSAASPRIPDCPNLTIRSSLRSLKIDMGDIRAVTAVVLSELHLSEYSVSISFVSDKKIRELNRDYRNIDKATDVLSFPFQRLNPPPGSTPVSERPLPPEVHGVKDLGEIVISPNYVLRDMKKEPSRAGRSLGECLREVLVHGMCHLLGYDHETDEDAKLMFSEQNRLMEIVQRQLADPPSKSAAEV